jgi:hypothetical protein
LLANVSNRHLAVERVVRGSARAVGLACAIVDTPGDPSKYVVHAVWAIMARDPAALTLALGDLPRSISREPDVLWTDTRTSVLSILR